MGIRVYFLGVMSALRRWGKVAPLGLAVGLFALGIVWGRYTAVPVGGELGGIFLALGLGLWGLMKRQIHGEGSTEGMVCAALGVAILLSGSVWWRFDQQYVGRDHVVRLVPGEMSNGEEGSAEGRALVRVQVQVLTDPEDAVVAADLPTVVFGGRRPAQRFMGEVVAFYTREEGASAGSWTPCQGRVAVSIARNSAVVCGGVLEICGWAKRVSAGDPWRSRVGENVTQAGESSYAQYLAAGGVLVQLTALQEFQSRVISGVDNASGFWPRVMLERSRHWVGKKLLGSMPSPEGQEGQVLSALLLGQRDPAIQEVAQNFSDAGVAHLLAISGTHVVLVAGIVWWMLQLLVYRPRWRAPLTMQLVLIYVALTPAGPPALRAGLATVLFLLAAMLVRRPQPMNLLLLVLGVVLLWRPGDLFDAGTQLSFVTTAGLILLCPGVYRRLFGNYLDRHGAIARAIGSRWQYFLQRWRTLLCQLVCANLVGSMLAAPLVAFYFNQLNLWAVGTGLVMLPGVMLLLVVGVFQLGAALVWTKLAVLMGGLAQVSAGINIWLVGSLARLPGATVTVRAPPVWWVVLCYAGVMLWLNRSWLKLSRIALILLACTLGTLGVGWYVCTARGSILPGQQLAHVWALDVGRGSCLVVETSGRKHLLINAGSASKGNLERRVIEPFLKSQGIGTIDGLLLSGLSYEQASASGDLVGRYGPRHLFINRRAVRPTGLTYAESELRGRLGPAFKGGEWLVAGDWLQLDQEVALTVLWPLQKSAAELKGHQGSLIMRLDLGEGEHKTGLLIVQAEQELPLEWLARGGESGPLVGCAAALILGPVEGDDIRPALAEVLERANIREYYYYLPGEGWRVGGDDKDQKVGRGRGEIHLVGSRMGFRLER